jgi:hypothetical protein
MIIGGYISTCKYKKILSNSPISNLSKFVKDFLYKVDAFQRIKCFSETFNSIFCKLTAKLNDLSSNQKSLMFYFLAKSGKPNK